MKAPCIVFATRIGSGGRIDVLELFREMTFKRQTMIVGGYAKMLLDEKIKSQSSADQYFEQNCEKLATGLLMYALYGQLTKLDPSLEGTPGPHAAMIKHYAMLALKPEDELQELIKFIIKNTGDPLASGYIARDDARQFIKFQLGAFSGMDSKQWSSIASSLSGPVGWMSKPPFVEMLCGTTFSLREFAGGNMDVFIQLSSNILQENRGLVRLLIGAMLKTQMDGGFKVPEIPTLYMLDEVDALGYMSALTEARDRGRKFGIALALLYQSEGQLKLHFGEDSFGAWFDTAALRSYALVSQNKVAKELSETIGEATAVIENRSSSSSWADALLGKNLATSSRVTTSENLQKRALMFSWDILKMRSDAQLVLVASQPALLCGRSIFFRRPEMLAMTEQSRVRSGAGREDADLEPIAADCVWLDAIDD